MSANSHSNPLNRALRPHTFDCLRRPVSSPRRMERRGGGCSCCNAVAGTAAILELNSAAVAPHHAPVAARRAARCCFVFVGGSASRLAARAMLPRDALVGALTLDDHRCHWLALLLWKPRVAAACMCSTGGMGDGCCFGDLLFMLDVGFCGADGRLAAACINCIASASSNLDCGSPRPISR